MWKTLPMRKGKTTGASQQIFTISGVCLQRLAAAYKRNQLNEEQTLKGIWTGLRFAPSEVGLFLCNEFGSQYNSLTITMHLYLTNWLDLIDSSSCVSVWVWSTAPCKLLLLVSSRSNIQLPEVYVLRSIKGHQLLQVLTAAQMYACCCFLCIWLRVAAVAAGEPMCEKMEPVPTFSCIDRVIDWTWIRSPLKSKRLSPYKRVGSWLIGVSQSIKQNMSSIFFYFSGSPINHPCTLARLEY